MRRVQKISLWWPLFVIAAWCLALPWPAAASPLVSAHYAQQKANAGILQLTIAAPAPSSVIVSLTLPEGNDIVAASPDFKKHAKKSREIKWLLKEVTPGTRTISFELAAPFSFPQLHCIVQYMAPGNGKMITLKVAE